MPFVTTINTAQGQTLEHVPVYLPPYAQLHVTFSFDSVAVAVTEERNGRLMTPKFLKV
jgi:hypothetical protein